jgi:broad specificity phosphatase PhoE
VLEEVKFLSLEKRAADRRVAVVTHAGVLRTVLCALHGYAEDTAWEQTRSYCSVVRHIGTASYSARNAEAGS